MTRRGPPLHHVSEPRVLAHDEAFGWHHKQFVVALSTLEDSLVDRNSKMAFDTPGHVFFFSRKLLGCSAKTAG